jgi:glutathione S-transferase
MILIGQYDSPFVRRVAIAMRLYGLPFEHRPWSAFSDAEKIAPYNPLRRVPTLVLDDGEAVIESTIILDYLDGLARSDNRRIIGQPAATLTRTSSARGVINTNRKRLFRFKQPGQREAGRVLHFETP